MAEHEPSLLLGSFRKDHLWIFLLIFIVFAAFFLILDSFAEPGTQSFELEELEGNAQIVTDMSASNSQAVLFAEASNEDPPVEDAPNQCSEPVAFKAGVFADNQNIIVIEAEDGIIPKNKGVGHWVKSLDQSGTNYVTYLKDPWDGTLGSPPNPENDEPILAFPIRVEESGTYYFEYRTWRDGSIFPDAHSDGDANNDFYFNACSNCQPDDNWGSDGSYKAAAIGWVPTKEWSWGLSADRNFGNYQRLDRLYYLGEEDLVSGGIAESMASGLSVFVNPNGSENTSSFRYPQVELDAGLNYLQIKPRFSHDLRFDRLHLYKVDDARDLFDIRQDESLDSKQSWVCE